MYLFDTSAILEILYGTEKGNNILKILKEEQIITTSITLHEVAIGEEMTRLETALNFFGIIEILPFDKECALQSSSIEKELTKKGKKINRIDILIAGICKKHNLTLITLDNDFKNIDSIKAKIL